MRIWTALVICVVVGVGCEPGDRAPSSAGDGSVPEGCPETEGPFVRGRVLVPDLGSETGDRSDGDGAATSGRERREVPAGDAAVALVDGGEDAPTTRTDADGRWCLDIGGRETGMDLVARAGLENATLRRPVITREGQIISVRSEAVLRVLNERVGDPSSIPPAVFLNLEAVASTATDLLDPVEWRGTDSIEAVVEKIVGRIAEDPRFSNTVKTLEAREKE